MVGFAERMAWPAMREAVLLLARSRVERNMMMTGMEERR